MARRSNWSILKKIKPVYIVEGLMLTLQYFGHPMQRADSLEKTLMLGKIEGMRKRGWQWIRWVRQHHQPNGHESEQTRGDSGGQRSLVCFTVHCSVAKLRRLRSLKVTEGDTS